MPESPYYHRERRYYYSDYYDSLFWWGFCIFGVFFFGIVIWAVAVYPHTSSYSRAALADEDFARTAATVTPYRTRTRSTESTAPHVRIESHWTRVEPGVYDLGLATFVCPKTGKNERVRGAAHMLYANESNTAHSVGAASFDPLPNTSATTCSVSLGANTRWVETLEWIIDPSNGDGIPRDLIVDSLWNAVNQFERRLPSAVMLGQDTSACADGIDFDSPDGKNEIMFGFIDEPGILAVMIGWTNSQGRLVNTDILFNLRFEWGNGDADTTVYDIENVATHEVGHAYGQGHIDVEGATMQPTASRGETRKRDLLACEAAGLCTMYGESSDACSALSRPAVPRFVDVGPGSRCEGVALPPPSSHASPNAKCSALVIGGTLVSLFATH